MNLLDYFDKYQGKLGGRFATFKMALMILSQIDKSGEMKAPMIVETGCLRADGDWGGGQSTFIFAEYVKMFGGYFHSVDINPTNVAMCEFVCHSLPVNMHIGDSVEYLKGWGNGKIDLLYLDSFDYSIDNPELAKLSQDHQLNEMQTAYQHLADKAVILLDDVDFLGGGKGRLSEAYLGQTKCINIYRSQQSIWLKGF